MTLLDVLIHEQLREVFVEARRRGRGENARLVGEATTDAADVFDGRGTAVRITTTDGRSLVVTPRAVLLEGGEGTAPLADFTELVGYDWISEEMADKVAEKPDHYDRLYLHLQGERTVLLDNLGDAVYPLMTFFGKVLELRSQKVIRRRMEGEVADVVSACLRAAVEGPFFSDAELVHLFEQDRASLTVLAGMWTRMNLAAPDLRRRVGTVMEMLLERGGVIPRRGTGGWAAIPPW